MATPVVEPTTRRFNLTIVEELYREMQKLAVEEHTTVVELLRRFIKLGLLARKLQDSPDEGLFIRQGGQEHKVMLF